MPRPAFVLLQEIIAVKLLVLRPALNVVGDHGPGLVGIGQLELEHGLEEGGIGGVLHDPLGLQPAGGLSCGELLCRSRGGCGVFPALEGVRDADDLPGFLINLPQVGQVLLDVPWRTYTPIYSLSDRFGR